MLNPGLFALLKRTFGNVRVSNENIRFSARIKPTEQTQSAYAKRMAKPKIEVIDHGESYRVNCPICGESRGRLYVNHMLGCEFEGIPMQYAYRCYNEDCQNTPELRKIMRGILNDELIGFCGITSDPAVTTRPPLDWPGEYVDFGTLPATHPVVTYLDGRGFDQRTLSDVWQAKWLTSSEEFTAQYRTFFPLFDGAGKFAGGQSRFFDLETNSGKPPNKRVPKWLTQHSTPRGKLLYNGHRAGNSLLVAVEGPFDAIKIGPEHAIATFGKSIAGGQATAIKERWGPYKTPIVLAYDADAWTKDAKARETAIERFIRLMADYPGKILPVYFEPEHDAGSMTCIELWDYLTQALKRAGEAK